MSTGCSDKSKYKNNPMYECGPSGKYRLKKGYKKQSKVGAPKRPLTAYFLWAKDNRESFKQQYPGAKVTEIAKYMGAEWKTLSASQKQPYVQKAEAAKKQYGQKAEQFKSTQGSLTEVIEKPKVKKAPSAYILWSKVERPKIKQSNPTIGFGDMSKELGARWKKVPENEKAIWKSEAEKLKNKF